MYTCPFRFATSTSTPDTNLTKQAFAMPGVSPPAGVNNDPKEPSKGLIGLSTISPDSKKSYLNDRSMNQNQMGDADKPYVPPIVIEPQSEEYMRGHGLTEYTSILPRPPPPPVPPCLQLPNHLQQDAFKHCYLQNEIPPMAYNLANKSPALCGVPIGTLTYVNTSNSPTVNVNCGLAPFTVNASSQSQTAGPIILSQPTLAQSTLAQPTLVQPTLAQPTLAQPTLAQPTLAQQGKHPQQRNTPPICFLGNVLPNRHTLHNRVYIPMTAQPFNSYPRLRAQLGSPPVRRGCVLGSPETTLAPQGYKQHYQIRPSFPTKSTKSFSDQIPTNVKHILPVGASQSFNCVTNLTINDENDDIATMQRSYMKDVRPQQKGIRPEVSVSGNCVLTLGPVVCAIANGPQFETVTMVVVSEEGKEALSNDKQLMMLPNTKLDYQQIEDSLPLDIKATMSTITMRSLQSKPGQSFLGTPIGSALQYINQWCSTIDSSDTHRDILFTYLAKVLRCDKDTLIQEACTLMLDTHSQRLKSLFVDLKLLVDAEMLWQVKQWEYDCTIVRKCQQQWLQQQYDWSPQEEKNPQLNPKEDKTVVLPQKNFAWNHKLVQVVLEIITVHMLTYTQVDDHKAKLIAFVESKLTMIWPKGWMTTKKILDLCLDEMHRKNGKPCF